MASIGTTYIDCFQYLRAATGLALSSMVSNPLHFGATQASGATTLTVPNTQVSTQLNPYDDLYIFDGAKSEVVQVGALVPQYTASIPLVSGLQYQHSAGVAMCTDGTQGSLGQALFESAKWLEDICYQSLWQATYTGEALPMATPRANIDNQGGLNFRPMHFPVTAVSALSLTTTNSAAAISYDTTQVQLDALQRLVTVPVLKPLNSGQQSLTTQFSPSLSRSQKGTLTFSYTAGFATGQLPGAVTRAATLLCSEMFSQTVNPQGADSVMMGKRNVTYTMRGDLTGESLLVKQATKLLARYSIEVY